MPNPFIRKLEHGADLTEADRATLRTVTAKTRRVGGHRDLIAEGDRPEDVRLVMSGFAHRYKVLPNGRHQTLAYLVPGDICDLHVAILGEMDHSIATLCPCEIVDIPRTTVDDLTANHPRITRALWWATLVDEAITREWLVSLGQRPAEQRIAHLFCELHLRLSAVGLVTNDRFDLPLVQSEIAETMGLSPVHVNRCLQELRGRDLIVFKAKTLDILDLGRLRALAGFNPNYLHLTPRPKEARTAAA